VQFLHKDIENYLIKINQQFDVIVSNPPFFENSLKSPETNRNISRHNVTLSLDELAAAVDLLLTENGRFAVILPIEVAEKLEKLMLHHHLYTTKKTWIYPTPTKKANRILMLFERKPAICSKDTLTIRNDRYTDEYYKLVNEYITITN
jgi:tRNA1Val (adenine37-N6)-methyltransferase